MRPVRRTAIALARQAKHQRRMRPISFSAALIATAASAQSTPVLDARAAQAIVAGCAAHSSAKHQSEAIVVVDIGGHVIASLLMDGNSSGIYDFALAKAEAGAAWG